MNNFSIRFATIDDAEVILEYIIKLAENENEREQVIADVPSLEKHLFEENGAEVLIAEYEGKPIGFAVFHKTFSTYLSKPGIHLDDFYIDKDMRNNGFGMQILKKLSEITKERGCTRLEWWVHDNNHKAIKFYKRNGAEIIEDLRICRKV